MLGTSTGWFGRFGLVAALAMQAGCMVPTGDHERRRGGGDERCSQGVYFDVGDVGERFAGRLPVAVRACFDDDCDELSVVAEPRLACTGEPGGPPDQLTWCEWGGGGQLAIAIERLDERVYDGEPHTAAISIRGAAGQLLYARAVAAPVGPGCGLVRVDATR